MIFNDSMKIAAAAAAGCSAIFLSSWCWAHKDESLRANRARYAFVHKEYAEGIELYRELSGVGREDEVLRSRAEEACEKIGLSKSILDEKCSPRRYGLLGGFCAVLFGLLFFLFKPKKTGGTVRRDGAKERMATDAQIAMIRKLDHWHDTRGLSYDQAKKLIGVLVCRKLNAPKQKLRSLDPYRFMTPAQAKKAHDRMAREEARVAKAAEREALKAQREEDARYKKREAEQEKLYKLRDDLQSGTKVRKAKAGRNAVIQEFQQLLVGVLADNRIEPQEVREIKAWLQVNELASGEFSSAIKLMDETLADGVIDREEEAKIFEAVMDCLVVLRARKEF